MNNGIGQLVKVGAVIGSLGTIHSKTFGEINMQIIEDYAQRKVDEKCRIFVLNLRKKGLDLEDIARIVDVDLDFVKKTLSE